MNIKVLNSVGIYTNTLSVGKIFSEIIIFVNLSTAIIIFFIFPDTHIFTEQKKRQWATAFAFMAILSSLWRQRNGVIFRGLKLPTWLVTNQAREGAKLWTRVQLMKIGYIREEINSGQWRC